MEFVSELPSCGPNAPTLKPWKCRCLRLRLCLVTVLVFVFVVLLIVVTVAVQVSVIAVGIGVGNVVTVLRCASRSAGRHHSEGRLSTTLSLANPPPIPCLVLLCLCFPGRLIFTNHTRPTTRATDRRLEYHTNDEGSIPTTRLVYRRLE